MTANKKKTTKKKTTKNKSAAIHKQSETFETELGCCPLCGSPIVGFAERRTHKDGEVAASHQQIAYQCGIVFDRAKMGDEIKDKGSGSCANHSQSALNAITGQEL